MCVRTASLTCLFARLTFYSRPDSRKWQTLCRVQRQAFSRLRVRGLGGGFQHLLCISSPGRSHILALTVAFSCPAASFGTVLERKFPYCSVNLHLKQGLSRFKHYEHAFRAFIEALFHGPQSGSEYAALCALLACPQSHGKLTTKELDSCNSVAEPPLVFTNQRSLRGGTPNDTQRGE
jgi:hypothetical protein